MPLVRIDLNDEEHAELKKLAEDELRPVSQELRALLRAAWRAKYGEQKALAPKPPAPVATQRPPVRTTP